MLSFLMLSMTVLSSAQAVERPQVTRGRINEVVKKVMQERHIPGLSIAVSMPGGKVIEEIYGLANLEYKEPVEKDSIFAIGSISKTFTAIAAKITKPLGMTHTALGSNSAIVPKRVSGYTYAGSIMNADYASLALPYASGGILSTPSDMIKLAKVFRGGALLKEKSIGEMFGPARLNNGTSYESSDPGLKITFGYGLDSIVVKERIIPAKTGSISGFNSFFAYFPESQTMVAVTSNLNNSLQELLIIVDDLFGLSPK